MELQSVSCPTVARCFAVDNDGRLVSFLLSGRGAASWKRTVIDGTFSLNSISCPTSSFCAAVDADGNVVSSRGPGGGQRAWHSRRAVQGGFGLAVTCPSRALCVALERSGNFAGGVAVTENPAAAKARWRFTPLPGALVGSPYTGPEGGVSCPSPVLCVIATGIGVITSTDPAGGAGAWIPAQVASVPFTLTGVSCPSLSLCVAVSDPAGLVTSVDPTGGVRAWTRAPLDANPGGFALTGIACPSKGFCFAVDSGGNAFTTSAPAGSWRHQTVEGGYNSLGAVVCPTARVCVAHDDAGNVFSSRSPFTPRTRWRAGHIAGAGAVLSMSCPSSSLCVGYDNEHHILSSTDPTGGAAQWHPATVDPAHTIDSLACPTPTLCVAVDDAGNTITSTTPAGPSGAWSITYLDDTTPSYDCAKYGDSCGSSLDHVTCGSAQLCAAVDQAGDIIATTNPRGGPTDWHTVAGLSDVPELAALQCPSAGFCFGVDGEGNGLATSTDPARSGTWTRSDPSANGSVVSGSCPSPSLCVLASTALPTSYTGGVLISTNPTTATPHWKPISLIPNPSPILSTTLTVTCPHPSLCLVLDGSVSRTGFHGDWVSRAPRSLLVLMLLSASIVLNRRAHRPAGAVRPLTAILAA